MHDAREVVVLRYGHRPGRDDRMTTHVGLTARALGADRVIFPDNAGQSAETVRDITDRFGGPFAVELRDDQKAIVRNFEGRRRPSHDVRRARPRRGGRRSRVDQGATAS